MRVRWVHTGCDAQAKRVLKNAWQNLELALQDRLDDRELQAEELIFDVQHDGLRRGTWLIEATLVVPGNTLLASAESADPVYALDDCVAAIANQLVELPINEEFDACTFAVGCQENHRWR